MQYQSANPKIWKKASSVFPCLPNCNHSATSTVDCYLFTDSLRAAFVFQLLDSFSGAEHRAFLDSRQLPRTAARERLSSNFVSFHVDCGPRDDLLVIAWLSTRLLPFI